MTTTTALARIDGLYAGRVKTLWEGKAPSAIDKQAVSGRVVLGQCGLKWDEQADLSVHGGPDKALHHYAADHIATWREELPERAERFRSGGFGENISTTGVTEADLCIGNVIEVGSAVLQVSHGRQPCWKFAAHIGQDDFAYRVRKTGRTGWYYRVLQEGEIGVGDVMFLKTRPQPDWTVERVVCAHFAAQIDRSALEAIAALPELAEVWRRSFQARLQKLAL